MKYLLILSILLPLHSFSQSGYLGSKTNIQLNITNSITPLKYKGKLIDESNYKETNLNLNTSYALTVNRVLNDNIQIGIGYGYAPMVLFTNLIKVEVQNPNNPNTFQNTNARILSSKRVDHHSFIFNFRNYKHGISPVGKGWGIDIAYGRTSVNELDIDYTTGESITTNGIFTKHYLIENTASNYINSSVTLPGNLKANSFVIKGYLGRTIPVSKKIGIDLSLSIPILRVLMLNDQTKIAYLVTEKRELSNSVFNNNQAIAYAIRKYNGFSFNIGVKYFI